MNETFANSVAISSDDVIHQHLLAFKNLDPTILDEVSLLTKSSSAEFASCKR